MAFVQQRGVNILERQLVGLPRGRLVTTTVFGGDGALSLVGAIAYGAYVSESR